MFAIYRNDMPYDMSHISQIVADSITEAIEQRFASHLQAIGGTLEVNLEDKTLYVTFDGDPSKLDALLFANQLEPIKPLFTGRNAEILSTYKYRIVILA
jgi:hypothetical protein